MESHNGNLTPTSLAHKLIAELQILADLFLSKISQGIIKRFFVYILDNRSAIADATHLLPLESALVIIQVKEYERIYAEIEVLHKRIDEIERENKTLKKKLDEEI